MGESDRPAKWKGTTWWCGKLNFMRTPAHLISNLEIVIDFLVEVANTGLLLIKVFYAGGSGVPNENWPQNITNSTLYHS